MGWNLIQFVLVIILLSAGGHYVDSGLTIAFFEKARAQAEEAFEPYSVRPSIFDVKAKPLEEQSVVSKREWDSLKRALGAAGVSCAVIFLIKCRSQRSSSLTPGLGAASG